MGINASLLPEEFLNKMDPRDRKVVAKGQLTKEEALERYCWRLEKELHIQYEGWLKSLDIDYTHSRMDKPSTIKRGTLDFHVWRGSCHGFVEFKMPEGRLSDAQKFFIARQERYHTEVLVATQLITAIRWTRRVLNLPSGDNSCTNLEISTFQPSPAWPSQ